MISNFDIENYVYRAEGFDNDSSEAYEWGIDEHDEAAQEFDVWVQYGDGSAVRYRLRYVVGENGHIASTSLVE